MTNLHLPHGYRFSGVHCGIRPGDTQRRDVALFVSDVPASAAGVFTQNRVCAAPVRVSRERVPASDLRGIVACSGNANACTGDQGMIDARHMAALSAEIVGCRPEQFLVASTGVIGRVLPMPRVEEGIRKAARELGPSAVAFAHAAHAILTTDTRTKISTRRVRIGKDEVTVAGVAKGAAMIGPNMATMLSFLLSDAAVSPDDLQKVLGRAVNQTFNCISVEGHTSTNDTVLLLANGTGPPLKGDALTKFGHSAMEVCSELARAIAEDAEGATHLIRIEVEGLRTDAEARQVAKTIADSALVKTAIFGADPNWGRIVSAAGYSGVSFEEEQLSLWIGDLLLYDHGTPQPFDAAAASAFIKASRDIVMTLKFTLGQGRCTYWTCDLGYEYVRLNADYTT